MRRAPLLLLAALLVLPGCDKYDDTSGSGAKAPGLRLRIVRGENTTPGFRRSALLQPGNVLQVEVTATQGQTIRITIPNPPGKAVEARVRGSDEVVRAGLGPALRSGYRVGKIDLARVDPGTSAVTQKVTDKGVELELVIPELNGSDEQRGATTFDVPVGK